MKNTQESRQLRIWPAVVIVALQWLLAFGIGAVAPGTPAKFFGMMAGPPLGLLLLFGWWMFASRAPRGERWMGVLLPLAGFVAAFVLAHRSATTAVFSYGIPVFCLLFLLWSVLAQRWPGRRRRLSLIALILISTLGWALLRSAGVDGDMAIDLSWRWSQTAEQRLLAADFETGPAVTADDPAIGSGTAAWPGFRGAARDGVVSSPRIATNWSATPPEQLWKQPVGPGWSSFAVAGELIFTQEQRGEEEIVVAYRAATGDKVWQHADLVRFWEPMAGAGPRATPQIEGGRLFSLGATGILNALDAATGSLIWSRDVATDSGAAVPEWGFASSPLRIDDLVVIYTGAGDGKAVVAYGAEGGEPRWFAAAGAPSYSSVHELTLQGVRQLLILTGGGATSLAPADGAVLWQHEWLAVLGGARIVQPVVTAAGDVLIGTGLGQGLRSLAVEHDAGGWHTEARWTSKRLKPYFNDFVVHRGHIYGFDDRIMSCLDVTNGERRWKGGRYGSGQLLLLADQDLLLVLSDRGKVAVVAATPQGFSELASLQAIAGKTWNHPVIADGVLYVRNSEEMAAFRLPLEQG